MSNSGAGRSPDQLRAIEVLAGAESDGAGLAVGDPETAAEWLQGDPEFVVALNRAKSFRRERLRAEVQSLASNAMAPLQELISGPDVPPSVRLRASLAIIESGRRLEHRSNRADVGGCSRRPVGSQRVH
jgi:hypothetical protein